MTHFVETYTYAEAIACLEGRIGMTGLKGKASIEEVKGRNSFYTTKTPQACIEVMRSGWKKGRDGLKAAIASMPAVDVDGIIQTFDVAGGLPDVPLYLSGEPEHFRTFGEVVEKLQPVVTLYVNRAAHCGIDAKSLAAWGGAIVRYALGLEAAGMTAEVIVYSSVRHGSHTVTSTVKVKEANEPWDLDRIAFTVAHGDMLRRVVFAMNERDEALNLADSDFFYGYGHPSDMPAHLRKEAPAGSIFFPRLENDITMEEAITRVDTLTAEAIAKAWTEAAA